MRSRVSVVHSCADKNLMGKDNEHEPQHGSCSSSFQKFRSIWMVRIPMAAVVVVAIGSAIQAIPGMLVLCVLIMTIAVVVNVVLVITIPATIVPPVPHISQPIDA